MMIAKSRNSLVVLVLALGAAVVVVTASVQP
jgi:hypothetical protein